MLTDQEITELMNSGVRLEYKGRAGAWVFKFKWPSGQAGASSFTRARPAQRGIQRSTERQEKRLSFTDRNKSTTRDKLQTVASPNSADLC